MCVVGGVIILKNIHIPLLRIVDILSYGMGELIFKIVLSLLWFSFPHKSDLLFIASYSCRHQQQTGILVAASYNNPPGSSQNSVSFLFHKIGEIIHVTERMFFCMLETFLNKKWDDNKVNQHYQEGNNFD